jgi:hypothetical protein
VLQIQVTATFLFPCLLLSLPQFVSVTTFYQTQVLLLSSTKFLFLAFYPWPTNQKVQDTAGTTQFENNADVLYRSSDGFLVMYAVNARATFAFVSELVEKIRLSKGKDMGENVPVEEIPIVIVGNKIDLVDGESPFYFYSSFAYFSCRTVEKIPLVGGKQIKADLSPGSYFQFLGL